VQRRAEHGGAEGVGDGGKLGLRAGRRDLVAGDHGDAAHRGLAQDIGQRLEAAGDPVDDHRRSRRRPTSARSPVRSSRSIRSDRNTGPGGGFDASTKARRRSVPNSPSERTSWAHLTVAEARSTRGPDSSGSAARWRSSCCRR
jgi:hypothetical protein